MKKRQNIAIVSQESIATILAEAEAGDQLAIDTLELASHFIDCHLHDSPCAGCQGKLIDFKTTVYVVYLGDEAVAGICKKCINDGGDDFEQTVARCLDIQKLTPVHGSAWDR
jgi:hypothetical protein